MVMMMMMVVYVCLCVCVCVCVCVCAVTESLTSSTPERYGVGATSLADSFVPGAISNQTLEHLTETTSRPHQFRAIRGEHHPTVSYPQYVPHLMPALGL